MSLLGKFLGTDNHGDYHHDHHDHYDHHHDKRRGHYCPKKICRSEDGPKLNVYKERDFVRMYPHRTNDAEWVPLVHGWDRPKFKSDAVEFRDGVVIFRAPGVYKYLLKNTVFTINEASVPVSGEAHTRVSKARHVDGGYEPREVLSTTIFSSLVPNRTFEPGERKFDPNVTSDVDVMVTITHEDIRCGYNVLVPEYKIYLFLVPGQTWPDGFQIGTTTEKSQNYIQISKIADCEPRRKCKC